MLFHPDRFADDLEKQEIYTRLIAAINAAKENGDIGTLREIAKDPAGYLRRQGWTAIDLEDDDEIGQLRKLYHSLEASILAIIEATGALKASAEYELYQRTGAKPEILEAIIGQQIEAISKEISRLETDAGQLEREIAELIPAGQEVPL